MAPVLVTSSESISWLHAFVVRSAKPRVRRGPALMVKPTRLGSCWIDDPPFGSAFGVIAVHWYTPALPLICAPPSCASPAGLNHADAGSPTRATTAGPSSPPKGPTGTPL